MRLPSGETKGGGAGIKTSTRPRSPASDRVVADAIVAALLEDIPPESTIDACRDVSRCCRITTRPPATEYVLLDDHGKEHPLGDLNRWYRSRITGGRLLSRSQGRDAVVTVAEQVSLCNDLPLVFPSDIDYAPYYKAARRTIQAVNDYPRLDAKHLSGRPLELHAMGLVPAPKSRKWQPVGLEPRKPTYLWDWPRYPSLGTYTGPDTEILVIDVDRPDLFKAWVSRGPGGRDEGPGRIAQLADVLVSVRGEAEPARVRRLQHRGKLIFRFPAANDHPLATLSSGR